jgi:alpha-ketoglutarate-dependent taurine dioxygenase
VTTIDSHVDLAITPLTGTTGAEIRGVSLRQPLPPATVADIRQALFDYKVVFFPEQYLSTDEHFAFAAHFGEITEGHPTSAADHGRWGLNEIDYTKIRETYAGGQDPTRKPRLGGWHTDVTFMETPPMGSILNAVAMPERGGDTVFANTQAAYEGLSAPFRGSSTDSSLSTTEKKRSVSRSGPRVSASGTAHSSPSSTRSSIRSCEPIPRPGSGVFSSTLSSPPTSRGSLAVRVTGSWNSCTSTWWTSGSSFGTTGTRATSDSGTTGPPCISWSSTTERSIG